VKSSTAWIRDSGLSGHPQSLTRLDFHVNAEVFEKQVAEFFADYAF
jgi:hypothetical protein